MITTGDDLCYFLELLMLWSVVMCWIELFSYEVWGIDFAGDQVHKLFVVKSFTYGVDQLCSPVYGAWIPFYC